MFDRANKIAHNHYVQIFITTQILMVKYVFFSNENYRANPHSYAAITEACVNHLVGQFGFKRVGDADRVFVQARSVLEFAKPMEVIKIFLDERGNLNSFRCVICAPQWTYLAKGCSVSNSA